MLNTLLTIHSAKSSNIIFGCIIWPKNHMLTMFWRGLDSSCVLWTIWDHCQVICCFDYIELLFYQYWLLWCCLSTHYSITSVQSHWNVYTLVHCHNKFLILLFNLHWQSNVTFILHAVQVLKVLYQLSPVRESEELVISRF